MGSREASLTRLRDAISRTTIPLGLVNLIDRCVLFVNEAAAELFGRPQAELIGTDASLMAGGPDPEQGKQLLEALARGAIDSYHARRRIYRPSGSVDVWVWTRTVAVEGGLVALAAAAPVDESDPTGRLISAYFGPDGIDAALGNAQPSGAGQPFAAGLAPAPPEPVDVPADERLADLERQILHIAAELHAVSDARRGGASVESRRPALDALHPRQRDIVDRLLRGERVSTIAEAMYLSPSTVRNHLSKVFQAFGVNSQASLLAALRSDVEEPPPGR